MTIHQKYCALEEAAREAHMGFAAWLRMVCSRDGKVGPMPKPSKKKRAARSAARSRDPSVFRRRSWMRFRPSKSGEVNGDFSLPALLLSYWVPPDSIKILTAALEEA